MTNLAKEGNYLYYLLSTIYHFPTSDSPPFPKEGPGVVSLFPGLVNSFSTLQISFSLPEGLKIPVPSSGLRVRNLPLPDF